MYIDVMLKKLHSNKNEKKFNGKYWSSYVQWKNLLLLSPYSVDKNVGKTSFFFALSTVLLTQ